MTPRSLQACKDLGCIPNHLQFNRGAVFQINPFGGGSGQGFMKHQ